MALTFMDGQLFSLYPLVDDLYTLTHVKHSPLGQFDHVEDAINASKSLNDRVISGLRQSIETHVTSYFPAFSDFFEYESFYTSIKTKRKEGRTDSRMTCIDHQFSNIYSIHSGKIDTIFDIENQIINIISAT